MLEKVYTIKIHRKTYVDLNRSGVALMEIVSEPDLRSIEEVGLYISKIRSILMYLDTCDGKYARRLPSS